MTKRLDPAVKSANKIKFGKIRSDRMKGEGNHFYGNHHSQESIEKNKAAHIGKPSCRKGAIPTEETKEKIRVARVGNFCNPREPVLHEGLIRLSNGEIAIVDISDYANVNRFLWSTSKCRNVKYAHRTDHGKTIMLHHAIMGIPEEGLMIDHINGNGLDNRRCNLRVVTNRENCQNKHWRKGSPISTQCTPQEEKSGDETNVQHKEK
jgi:hypothetical protein